MKRLFHITCAAVFVLAASAKTALSNPALSKLVAPNIGQTFAFGALQSDPARASQMHAAGVTIATIEVGWDRCEPRQGVWNRAYFAETKAKMQKLRAAKQEIVLDLGVQYPPAWVFDLPYARFVNQYDATYDSAEAGKNVPNAVFNQAVRACQAAYMARVFQELGTNFHHVRLGGGWYGELHFPPATFKEQKNCYWAYDALAQGRAPGLAAGLRPCPVPNWKPGEPSAQHRAASLFANWYLNALQNYHDWQIATARRFYSGPLAMLYPGWGVRPGQLDGAIAGDLDGTTSVEQNGELQAGGDFARFVASVRDPNVIVYTTWIDAPFGDDASREPAQWTPAHWLAYLAAANPLDLPKMGENTGSNDVLALQRSVQRMRAYNLRGIMWAFESQLFASEPKSEPKHATLAQLREAIAQQRDTPRK